MSHVKTKLKQARDAIGKKDFSKARDAALQVLEYEPDNYNANVFLALAHLELGELAESEQAYQKAIELNKTQVLAWQGLSKFYERIQAWDKYVNTLDELIQLFMASGDASKTAETLQRLIQARREHGNVLQLVDALTLLLPESKSYQTLSLLPEPDPTNPTSTTTLQVQMAISNSLPILEEIVELLETYEADTIKAEIQKRRTRLNAPPADELKKQVGLEVWAKSKLPHFYNEILNHPKTSDDLRRQTDSKLLRHRQQYLYALPLTGELAPVKVKVCAELDGLINGAIILETPDELAWMLFLEQKNCDTIEGYDFNLLRKYTNLFPGLPFTSLLRGYFWYIALPMDDEDTLGHDPEESLDLIMESYPLVDNSLLATRIVADVYVREMDYSSAVASAENGLKLLALLETQSGKKLPRVRIGLKTTLATSLVHLFPPKHHIRAMQLIDEVLAQSPENVPCLMGRGYTLQAAQKWSDAAELFKQVTKLVGSEGNDGLRAKEEYAWCLCRSGDITLGLSTLDEVLQALDAVEPNTTASARCLQRIGLCHWEKGGEEREEAYRCFIAALKRDSSYAPAFTSLGIYYSEGSLDPVRASKCFQKAFELDAREGDAARRLAIGFANEKEWDLVEVIARRTIEGEGGLQAGLKQNSNDLTVTQYLPTYAWAWKGVGLVELVRQNYSQAIHAFHVALRAEPQDHSCWIRLGEAYTRAGRHTAALKALQRARELQPEDWTADYFTGDLYRQMGLFEEALTTYESLSKKRPRDVGVLAPLAHTYLDLAQVQLNGGFIARSEISLVSCIRLAIEALEDNPGFRSGLWKLVADATFYLSLRGSFLELKQVRDALALVIASLPDESSAHIASLVHIVHLDPEEAVHGSTLLPIAIKAYDHRLLLSQNSSEDLVVASAWYDLGLTLRLLSLQKAQPLPDTVILCVTEAIKKSPSNLSYWLTLGDAHFSSDPRLAQHAYIRALELDSRDAKAWTNLGLMYLHHGDFELAQEALHRAQTLDPDYSLAWLGLGLLAESEGQITEARLLFSHVITLPAILPEADLKWSSSLFSCMRYQSASYAEHVLPAFIVLGRYCQRQPGDPSGLHLYGLVCESLGLLPLAAEQLSKTISILESAYEESESHEIETQFCIAHVNAGRVQLALGEYLTAIQSFETVLGLLSNAESANSSLLTLGQVGLGLANSKLGNVEAAISFFEEALEAAGSDTVLRTQITVLLSRTLWNIGTAEAKESAKAQLLQCIATDPDNLTAIGTLAAMGILTEDEGLVDAALSEILSLPVDRRHEMDPDRDITHLLIQHHLGHKEIGKAISLATRSVFGEPNRLASRTELATILLQTGHLEPVPAILSGSPDSCIEADRVKLSLSAIANTLLDPHKHGHLRDIQRAIMITPWEVKNWQAFTFVKGRD